MIKPIQFYLKRPSLLFINTFYRIRSLLIIDDYELIIIDDVFPHPLSAFRYEEFVAFLNYFGQRVQIFTTGHSLKALHQKKSIRSFISLFKKKFPNFKTQIKVFQYHRKVRAKLAYVLFLDNAIMHLDYFERNSIPFILTLYPGAGFFLNQVETNNSLKKLMSSPLFRGVITTQINTTEYLVQNQFCLESKIKFIFGVVTPFVFLNNNCSAKRYFNKNKMNIVFVANKQMPLGLDKGYDLFIAVAKELAPINDNILFHVVGPYNSSDIDVELIKNKLKFYGYLETNDLLDLYKNIDIIISPNKPFILKPGAFDGFPTGACSEAALNGILMLVTDPLELNTCFIDNEDIIIIKPEVKNILDKLVFLYENPDLVKKIALSGKQKANKIYSYSRQIQPRINFILDNLY